MPRYQKTYSFQVEKYDYHMKDLIEHINLCHEGGAYLREVDQISTKGQNYLYFKFSEPVKCFDKAMEEYILAIKRVPYVLIKNIRDSVVVYIKDSGKIAPETKYIRWVWNNRMIVIGNEEPYKGWVEYRHEELGKPKIKLINC